MTEREAHELVRSIESLWRMDLGADGRRLWRDALIKYESLVASEAIIKLSERQRERPTIADIRGMIAKTVRDKTLPDTTPVQTTPGALPEWVNIWAWLRFAMRDYRTLPQQADHRVPEMTPVEYTETREQWKAAGTPTITTRDLIQVLTNTR